MIGWANGDLYRRKVGTAVVAVPRAGEINVLNAMNHFFLIGQMIIVVSSIWNIGIGKEKARFLMMRKE